MTALAKQRVISIAIGAYNSGAFFLFFAYLLPASTSSLLPRVTASHPELCMHFGFAARPRLLALSLICRYCLPVVRRSIRLRTGAITEDYKGFVWGDGASGQIGGPHVCLLWCRRSSFCPVPLWA